MSLNKLIGSFIFGIRSTTLFFFSSIFFAIFENTVVWCLRKSCTQLAHDFKNDISTLNNKEGHFTN